jgi:MTH538 TIR-like domain (DUF1863)
MARRTFFSFQYKPDVTRAWNVRNSWVTKVTQGSREDAGFFDSSVFEASERENADTLKRFLREGLKNTSVTCVLVGETTTFSRWVRYETFCSFIRGNGLLAIRIHSIGSIHTPHTPPARPGPNIFDDIAFTITNDRVKFKEYTTSGWQYSADVGSMPLGDVRYKLGAKTNHTFSCIFPIYDWEQDNGRDNLNTWIESAAGAAER